MTKFSKMKVHYNHFVLYLANVAFGYGRISDTKFLKFSDKDWIWICKNFSDMDQELKNQYPLTSAEKSSGEVSRSPQPNRTFVAS